MAVAARFMLLDELQAAVLNDNHVSIRGMSRADASRVIQLVFDREHARLATIKQVSELLRLGYDGTELTSMSVWRRGRRSILFSSRPFRRPSN